MKSTCRPRTPLGSAKPWRHGWHTPARSAAGASGAPKQPARRAPATSELGHWQTVTMSAAAAASRQRYGRRTRRLMLDLSVRSTVRTALTGFAGRPPAASRSSSSLRPGRTCFAQGARCSRARSRWFHAWSTAHPPPSRAMLTKRDRQGGISGGRVTVVTRHRTLVDRAQHGRPDGRQPGRATNVQQGN